MDTSSGKTAIRLGVVKWQGSRRDMTQRVCWWTETVCDEPLCLSHLLPVTCGPAERQDRALSCELISLSVALLYSYCR